MKPVLLISLAKIPRTVFEDVSDDKRTLGEADKAVLKFTRRTRNPGKVVTNETVPDLELPLTFVDVKSIEGVAF